MYQALYRKWRPQTFDEVVGQKHITETLKNQVMTGRLSHAYIFIGTRGTGKTTCARILAKAVNCEHPVNGNPCGKCAACRGIADGSVLDIVELDAASNNGVDNVRALREEAVFSPSEVKKRVYIIDEVHMLSMSAFNALLKILEEPPEHLMFILATTELQKVPATILSRCQRHSFKRIEPDTMSEYLQYIASQEHLNLSPEAAELIARLAEGGVRDALSLLDQCSAAENIDVNAVYDSMGLAGNRLVSEVLRDIIKHDTPSVLKKFTEMWMNGKDPTTFLNELSGLLRDSLMVKVAAGGASALITGGYDMAVLRWFSDRMTVEQMTYSMNTLQGAISQMRSVKSPKITAEICLVTLCNSALSGSLDALADRVSRLEEQLKDGVKVSCVMPDTPIDEPPVQHRDDISESELAEYYNSAPTPQREVEYEDIDPAEFAEEQPEDVYPVVERRAAEEYAPAVAKTEAPKTEPSVEVSSEPVHEGEAFSWEELCSRVSSRLPRAQVGMLNDRDMLRGRLDGNVLHLEALEGLPYGQFNRQNILTEFAHAASVMTGKPVNCMIAEMKPEQHELRDINELQKFKEVKFIN